MTERRSGPKRPAKRLWLPSPEEIAKSCAEIQATWSPEEEERRRGKSQPVRMRELETPRIDEDG